MPTYEYKCPKCGTEFDLFQKMSSKPVAKCPKCGAQAKRLMSGGAGLVFKGSGFYLTDYGRAGQKPRSESESSSGESKSESSSGESKGSESKADAKPKPETKSESKPAKSTKKKAD